MGCSVKQLELAGYDARGIEPGYGFQQYAQDVLGARVERATLSEVCDGGQFDVVLLNHVIEHMPSPIQTLRQIRSMLRPGGRLYVECPNLAAPFARRDRLFHFAHIHNFTPTSLLALAKKAGFQVREAIGGVRRPNLKVVLEESTDSSAVSCEGGYEETMAALRRAGTIRYHLRFEYVKTRWRKSGAYVRDFVLGVHRRAAQGSMPLDSPVSRDGSLTPQARGL
jgi:SAM-dependent methyltransferase